MENEKNEKNKQNEQLLKQIEAQAEKEFENVLSKISSDETTPLLDDIYFIPSKFIKMVANGNAKGLILISNAGYGKTHLIFKTFGECNKKFKILSGHITSLELYHFLFENREKIIVLDDVNVLSNEINLNMLKACLSDVSRVVQYHTSSPRLKVPNKFVFNGRIIMLLNDIPKKAESLKAVESRILKYELKLDYKTKIAVIFELIKQDYKELTLEERQNIGNWIKTNTNEAVEDLNLRLLFKCYEFYRFDKENWTKLALKMIKINKEKELILQGLSEWKWMQETRKSRASYYNYKRSLNV